MPDLLVNFQEIMAERGLPYKVGFAGRLLLTSQVADVSDWTIDTINQRQKVLAKIALKAWPI